MGKPTGFIDYEREDAKAIEPKERIKNFKEFHIPLSMEKQQIQGARCMNCGVPFCQSGMTIMGMTSGCPLHNLVPEWNDLVYTGNWEQAYNRLKKTNNFPEFTSRVCPALCEAACTCGHWEDPVTCKANEHGIIENAYAKGYAAAKPPRVRTGKKVAIIGSGPAGLAAADQLNKRGHQVTVFERDDRVGGLLMYGIPNMKLEKWVIDRKVDIMKEEGVEFVTSVNVGKDVKAAKLLKDYDRVILACGAKNPRDIKAPGRDAKGIYFAVDFLKATTKSLLDSDLKDNNYISAKGKKVVIIGGGDTGNDCVGTSIRHGCASVTQLEMMPKAPDTRAAVVNELQKMEEEHIICGYHTLIDWDKAGIEKVTALIEVRVTPQRGMGFDKVAERIYNYPEVNSVYLISGGFDFMVTIEGKTLREVSQFVSNKLSPLDSVLSTKTNFILKKYKDHGTVMAEPAKDERIEM